MPPDLQEPRWQTNQKIQHNPGNPIINPDFAASGLKDTVENFMKNLSQKFTRRHFNAQNLNDLETLIDIEKPTSDSLYE